jgi:hypothetical protein
VIFSVAYQLTRCLLDCLMLLTRREASKEAELLVLRHEMRCCASPCRIPIMQRDDPRR